MSVALHPKDIKKGIHKNRAAEPFWCSRYRFSPYQNCEHGCIYCDGRAERYYSPGAFENDITVRRNLPEIMAEELSGLRERGIISGGSGVSDIYQPAEAELKLTRQCAEVILQADMPAAVATKSSLALRDLDLWGKVAGNRGFIFMMSLVTDHDDIRSIWEPGASPVDERIDTLKAFKEAGAATGVLAMPLLPGICDSDEDIKRLFSRLRDIGVEFIIPGGLTLRPGRQKDRYINELEIHRPDLRPLYRDLYAESRPSGSPIASYGRDLQQRCSSILDALEIPVLIPHRVFAPMMGPADQLHILFWHMRDLYAARGKDTRRLVTAAKRYAIWLDEQRKTFNRRRSLEPGHVDLQLRFLAESGDLGRALGNDKLAAFACRVILEQEIFDYQSLQLLPGKDTTIEKPS